jgi:hypothetical protein
LEDIYLSLSLLLLLPFVVYRLAKRAHSSRTWALTGLSFGLIVSPASLGFYLLYGVHPLGFLPGMLGLLSSFVHMSPGFEIATALGLRDAGTVVDVFSQEGVMIEAINGLFWGVVYGTLAHLAERA